ncbi:MAG TPA: hypothetical protein VHO24_17020 [Opitutaceae bacterium]|nr:hypothetical protein [Opitutaceae bacterium]
MEPTSQASPRFFSGGPWRASLLVALLVAAVWAVCFRFPEVWGLTGIGEGNRPFLDLYGLLASGERAAAGMDAFQPNPLDPYNRPSLYTEWWLLTGAAGLERGDTLWLGAALVGLTLFAALAGVKPRTGREAIDAALVLLSPAVLMAVQRANNDLVVFVLMSVALVCFRGSRPVVSALGVVLLAAGAAMKYYPLAAVVVLLHARTRRELAAWFALYAFVLLLAWPALIKGLGSASRFSPTPEWLYAFGAPVLARDFHATHPAFWIVPSVLLFSWAIWKAFGDEPGARADAPARAQHREFIAGSALIAGCFFLGASYVYKLIFSVWLLPWLWRATIAPPLDRWRRITAWLLIAVLWTEGLFAVVINGVLSRFSSEGALGALYVGLIAEQVFTWAFIACLARWLFADFFQNLRRLSKPT